MGSFFTNVQVRADEIGRDAVVQALRGAIVADGMQLVDADAPRVDRTIIVRGVDSGGWVAIYDTRTESQDRASLDALAVLASRVTRGAAFSVLVHDSDILLLGLFEGGALQDRFDSAPEYFEPRSEAEKRAVAGDPAKWEPLLGEERTPEELGAILRADDLFAERTLASLAEALGVQRDRATVGVRYLDDEQRDDEENVVIRACALERPAWERDAEGPPVFVGSGIEVPLVLAKGDEVRVHLSTLNEGGSSTGLRFAVWGPALDAGLVQMDSIELVLGEPSVSPTGRLGFERYTLEDARSAGGQMRALLLPSATIPAGPASSAMPTGGDWEGWQVAQSRGRIHASVLGRALTSGEGTLHVGLVSLAHPSSQTSMTYRARVEPPLWQPLRAAAPTSMLPQSTLMRPLSGDRSSVALAVLGDGATRDAEGVAAMRAFERLLDVSGFGGELHSSAIAADPLRRPSTKTHTRWPIKEIDSMLTGSSVLCLEGRLASGPAAPEMDMARMLEQAAQGGFGRAELGVAIGSRPLPRPGRTEALVVGMWLSSDAPAAARAVVQTWLDGLAESGTLLQATCSLAGWVPGHDLSSTDYERACGIHGMGTDLTWCERFLRWPGRERLFLGEALMTRLVRAELDEVAEVVDGAHGVWLRKHAHIDRSAWERALAGVLPTQEDARGFYAPA